MPMFVDQFTNPKFLESCESTEFWLVEKSLKRRLGHLCVKSNGQILGTVGLVLHIGSHSFGFWAGLHSELRATNEKSPNRSGQSVRFFGLMSVSEMMELGATEMRMKRVGKQEGEFLVPVIIIYTVTVAIAKTPATARTAGGAVANH